MVRGITITQPRLPIAHPERMGRRYTFTWRSKRRNNYLYLLSTPRSMRPISLPYFIKVTMNLQIFSPVLVLQHHSGQTTGCSVSISRIIYSQFGAPHEGWFCSSGTAVFVVDLIQMGKSRFLIFFCSLLVTAHELSVYYRFLQLGSFTIFVDHNLIDRY